MNQVQVDKVSYGWSAMWTVLKIVNTLMKHAALLQLNSITLDRFSSKPHIIRTHGCSISPIWSIRRLISVLLKAVPIMTDLRQALDANMALTLDGRHMVCGES